MLRSLFLWCTFLTVSYPTLAQDYPRLEEIVQAFFTRYAGPQELWELSFEKRPDAYYVCYNYKSFAAIECYPFYQYNEYLPVPDTYFSSRYSSTDGPEATDATSITQAYLRQLGYYTISEFDRYPYYGYAGWHKDVIEWGEQKSTLTDDELHTLARAYSSASGALIGAQLYALPEEAFTFAEERPYLSEEQEQRCLELINKAIATYTKLEQRNPNYMTPVGPVGTKRCNEHLYAFIILLQYQGEARAREVLIEGLYDDYLLIQARNYLASCPPNSVLVTYGDTDTYPLYYVQAMENLRTDVILVNSSLMEVPSYRTLVSSGPFGAAPLQYDIPELPEGKEATKIWTVNSDISKGKITANEFKAELDQEARTHGVPEEPYFLPNVNVLIPPPIALTTENNIAAMVLDTVEWAPFANTYYLTPGQLFLWNIIYAHQWQRPLCFSPTNRSEVFQAWEPYLAYNGLVYQVYPHRFPANSSPFIKNFAPNTYDFWANEMVYDTTTIITDYDKAPFHQLLLIEGLHLLEYLINNEQKENARTFLQQLPHRFPNNIDSWGDATWIKIAQYAKDLELVETKNLIIDTIANNLANGSLDDQRFELRLWLEGQIQQLRQ